MFCNMALVWYDSQYYLLQWDLSALLNLNALYHNDYSFWGFIKWRHPISCGWKLTEPATHFFFWCFAHFCDLFWLARLLRLAKMDDSEMGPVVLSVCSIVTPCVVYSLNFVLHQQLPLAVLSLNNPESQDEDALCRNKRFHEWMVLMNAINISL